MIRNCFVAVLCATFACVGCSSPDSGGTLEAQEASIPDDLYLAFTITGGTMDGTRVMIRDWKEMGYRNLSFLSGQQLKLIGEWQDWKVELTSKLPERGVGSFRYQVGDPVENANRDLSLRFWRSNEDGESESFGFIGHDASVRVEHYGEVGDLAAGRFEGQFVLSQNSGIDLIHKSVDELQFVTISNGIFRINHGTRLEFDEARQKRGTIQ
jgi:hypothetical protein